MAMQTLKTEGDGAELVDAQAADAAIRILREHKGKPFFLAVGFVRPDTMPAFPT